MLPMDNDAGSHEAEKPQKNRAEDIFVPWLAVSGGDKAPSLFPSAPLPAFGLATAWEPGLFPRLWEFTQSAA
jgi:hypothetical protein